MFKLTPKAKRIVAREWLVFMALVLLSPVPVNFVRWTHEGTGILLPESSDWFERVEKSADEEDAYRIEDYVEHPERLKLVPSVDEKTFYRDIPPRSFLDYLFHKLKHPSTYLDVLYVYPVYLLLCSLIWAVKTLKRTARPL
jgi:hypothetical protein